jgi:hypothetical protein
MKRRAPLRAIPSRRIRRPKIAHDTQARVHIGKCGIKLGQVGLRVIVWLGIS